MQIVVLIMQRKSIAQGLMQMLKEKAELNIYYESDYKSIDAAIRGHDAQIALIEISENGEYNVFQCLSLCEWLRKETPNCKLILMCPEQDKSSINEVVAAKKDRRIDEFIFYDTSVEYLATKLMSM